MRKGILELMRRDIFNKLSNLQGNELDMMMLLTSKMIEGSKKYGTWVAASDTRDYKTHH